LTLIIVLFLCTLIAALLAVFAVRLMMAAVCLLMASLLIALLMFRFSSPLAAVFELSICAGLITVIFISTISFVRPLTNEELTARRKERIKKYLPLPPILAVVGALSYFLINPANLPVHAAAVPADVRKLLWESRQADLLGQILILLMGVFGIVVLFRGSEKNEH